MHTHACTCMHMHAHTKHQPARSRHRGMRHACTPQHTTHYTAQHVPRMVCHNLGMWHDRCMQKAALDATCLTSFGIRHCCQAVVMEVCAPAPLALLTALAGGNEMGRSVQLGWQMPHLALLPVPPQELRVGSPRTITPNHALLAMAVATTVLLKVPVLLLMEPSRAVALHPLLLPAKPTSVAFLFFCLCPHCCHPCGCFCPLHAQPALAACSYLISCVAVAQGSSVLPPGWQAFTVTTCLGAAGGKLPPVSATKALGDAPLTTETVDALVLSLGKGKHMALTMETGEVGRGQGGQDCRTAPAMDFTLICANCLRWPAWLRQLLGDGCMCHMCGACC